MDRQARVAYERCAEQATSIIEGLKASADIETQQITVEPAREFESSTARLVGHQASTIVTARALVEQAGEIADLAMQSGATEIHGPQLAVRDRAAIELDALEQALADARRRAERLAAAARRALGPIVSIETRDEDYFPHVAELRSGGAPGMPVEVPAIEVNQSVTVVFALGD